MTYVREYFVKRIGLLISSIIFSGAVKSENQFDPAFLSSDPSAVADLSLFQNAGQQPPGNYHVDVFVNGQYVESKEIAFSVVPPEQAGADGTGLSPVLSLDYLKHLGLNPAAVPTLSDPARPEGPVDVAAAIPGATTYFDFSRQRLELSLPQAVLHQQARGLVPEARWDDGVTALMLNYNLSGDYGVGGDNKGESSNFLGLNSGLNLGPWRFRSYTTWNKGNGLNEWQHVNASVSRGLPAYKSKLLFGDSYTTSDTFDSLSFRGVQMSSDEEMYPDSLRGYAPVIRGIAKGNAKVRIKQNDYLIYQTNVSPGAFVIKDLYASSNSGDLEVEVEETDGSINRYIVPFASIPNLLREDRVKYSLTLGQYRSGSDEQKEPEFLQGSLAMGLVNDLTLYGGTQLSDDYQSYLLGAGKNLGAWGALSLDVTHANTLLPNGDKTQGQSLNIAYAKAFPEQDLTIQMLGAAYSSEGYYTFAESTYESMTGNVTPPADSENGSDSLPFNLYYSKRGRIEGSVSQQLGDAGGSVYLNAWTQSYWHTDEQDTTVQFGYSGMWKDLNYNLAYNYSENVYEAEPNRLLSVNLSMPLRWGSGNDAPVMNANYGLNYDVDGETVHSLGVSGTALDDHNLSYSLQQGFRVEDGSSSFSNASLDYKGARGNLDLGYSSDEDRQQVTYGASGGLVVHSEGVTLSQPLGNSNILIAAPGAEGVEIENSPGSRTNGSGYAVLPYASNYRYNRVRLDTSELPDNLEIDEAVVQVVPTSGALVRADFKARVGVRALLTLTHGGKAVPFGAEVSAGEGGATGIVGDEGVVYLSGLGLAGELAVRWGKRADEQCRAPYQLPAEAETQSISRMALECR